MDIITITELEGVNRKFMDRLDALVGEIVSPMIGRGVKVVRAFKERSDGSYIDHEVIVTVNDGFMNDNGEITLRGTYPHPHNGKPIETEINV
jgi:hypothetical protein